MKRLPRRNSLVVQLTGILRDALRARRWSEWLPEERQLARMYQVSRSTVRAALAQLRDDGWIETKHGLGTCVRRSKAHGAVRAHDSSVGVLIPRALDRFRYFTTLFVDDLRTLLFDRDYHLVVHEHPQVEDHAPAKFLSRLAQQHDHAAWLLVGCSLQTQRWFGVNRVPAVVSGTCDPALGLPFVCLDNHALGRHAGLNLLRNGHRRVGALLTHSNPALRTGLEEAFASVEGVLLQVLEIEDNAPSVARAVDRLLAAAQPPSAFFIAESSNYLSTLSRLQQRGLRVPQDVSLLCRDDEPYLASLLPTPARYSKNPHEYARRLMAHLLRITAGESAAHLETYIMPEFVAGGSLRRLAL